MPRPEVMEDTMLNYLERRKIEKQFKALSEGPSPLVHRVVTEGPFLRVHSQPWGEGIVLNYEQAETFLRDFHFEPARKPATSETRKSQAHKLRKMG